MKILEIYKKYQIMPQLAEHQLRVAGVASIILNNLTLTPASAKASAGKPALSQREREDVVAACLLHDMGNIVKFNLQETREKFMTGAAEEELSVDWEQIQEEFKRKYGTDSHGATMKIIQEIGVSPRVQELVGVVDFGHGKETLETSDAAKKICIYADMRVGPFGVVALEDRLRDLRWRYISHPEGVEARIGIEGGRASVDIRAEFESAFREIQKQIFERCEITPEHIDDETIKGEIERLRNYEVS